MKTVHAERFQKKKQEPKAEEIAFSGSPMPSEPPGERTHEGTNDRSDEETDERTAERSGGTTYVLEVPGERRKARHSFGIYEDQKRALDTLQMAVRDVEGEKPSLGGMVREALAAYIAKRTNELPNVRRKERGGD